MQEVHDFPSSGKMIVTEDTRRESTAIQVVLAINQDIDEYVKIRDRLL